MGNGFAYRILGDGMKRGAVHRFIFRDVCQLEKMPSNRFTFAIRVGGDIHRFRIADGFQQFLDEVAFAWQDFIGRAEIGGNIYTEFGFGQITDMSQTGFDAPTCP